MNIDFSNISYLRQGNLKQRTSYNILTDIDIFNILKEFKPVLAGTIPIDIDIDNSDLDVICTVTNFENYLFKERRVKNRTLICKSDLPTRRPL